MTEHLSHRLANLKTRVEALRRSQYDAASYQLDEESLSIFSRYNKLREELIQFNSMIFGDLIERKPRVEKEFPGFFDAKIIDNILVDIAECERGLTIAEDTEDKQSEARQKLFYSRRTNPAAAKDWLKFVGPAFFALVERLGMEHYFASKFSRGSCDWCSSPYGFNASKVNSKLREHLPLLEYPAKQVTQDQLFDFMEFFHEHAAKSVRLEDCGDDKCFKDFSIGAGKRYYSTEVNALLIRFGAPFRLINGEISRVNSKIVEELLDEPLVTDDAELNTLLRRAVQALRHRSDKRVEAAEICSKAFEHFKHLYGKDAKSSTSTMIKNLVETDDQIQKLNAYWLALTNLGHGSVRHSKPDSPSTNDPLYAEYLFLQYYSAIHFGCKKLGLLAEEPDEVFGLSLHESGVLDEIPFKHLRPNVS